MTKPGICYMDYYVPEQCLSVPEFVNQLDRHAFPPSFPSGREYEAFIKTTLQLEQIRIENEMDIPGMIGRLISEMFECQVVLPQEIDLLIVLGEPRMGVVKNLGQFLQYKYAMSKARVLNLSGNHCADLDVAIGLAESFCQGNVQHVLIVCATKSYSPAARVVGTYGVLGDAAGLVLIKNGAKLVQVCDQLVCCKGMLYEADMISNNLLLHAKNIHKEVTGLLHQTSIDPENIDVVVIQNANPVLFKHTLMQIGFRENTIFESNIGRYGHLDTIDLIVNLKSVLDAAEDEQRRLLAIGFGWAGTYTASLLTLNN